jgi:hypothetical protein
VYREGEVVSRCDEQLHVSITARVPHDVLGRLGARDGIEIEEVA